MTQGVLGEVRRGANLVKQQALEQLYRRRSVGPVAEARFEDLLERHASGRDTVFVHVGMSDVKSAFDTDPYAFLLEKLRDHFTSVLAPGFTDYFMTSGVYHKAYSRPKHGTFSRLFLGDADYRTDDAIKSILVAGPYRFEDCVHRDSYHAEGCFAKLVDDDVLVLDVGTPWLKCSHLHYFERRFDVDYLVEETFDGVLLEDGECREIEQTCHRYESKYFTWNRPRIERVLARRGVLSKYDLNGLQVLFFPLGAMERAIGDMLRADDRALVKV